MKGAALQSFGMFQGKYHASAPVNGQPSWTSKGNLIWYGHRMWFIGDGNHGIIFSSLSISLSNPLFPYDKEIQWYFQGKNFKKEKFKHGEIDTKCTMKTGEPYILDFKNHFSFFSIDL